MQRFFDRREAGKRLVPFLRKFQQANSVLLAVPRGGVPVAYEVARELKLPLDLLLVKKIGHPANREFAIGAAGLTDRFIVPHTDVSEEYLNAETERVQKRLNEMKQTFLKNRPPLELAGKTIILIDDGIATGNTLMAAVHILRNAKPQAIIVAVPVISKQALRKLMPVVEEIIPILVPDVFYGVGAFYHDFTQLTDEDIVWYLNLLNRDDKK